MSHYTVAVFSRPGQDIDELLAPFDENIEVEPYISFTRHEAIEYAKLHFNTDGKTDDECWQMTAGDSATDANGNIMSTYNPKSKWDWYVIGGRFSDKLKLKNGQVADAARVGDLVFESDAKAYEGALRFWDVVVEHEQQEPGEEYYALYNGEFYRERYKTRESYAKCMSSFATYAVVTPDGEWHAPGDMGWFGVSSETHDAALDWYEHYQERFIDAADPDWILTIVDCHI